MVCSVLFKKQRGRLKSAWMALPQSKLIVMYIHTYMVHIQRQLTYLTEHLYQREWLIVATCGWRQYP